jgi:hypothetical protein
VRSVASFRGLVGAPSVPAGSFGAGLWRLADPKISLASVASMALGAAALLPLVGLPPGVLLGLVALPFGAAAARRLLRDPEATVRIVPAQGWTLRCFILAAAGSALGLIL